MTAPKIYRYDDDNAPVASGLPGGLVGLLRACLVDGYGDKTPAGWSMPHANAEGTLAAFRNNPETGSGFWLQVDNPNNTAKLQGYENMTDEANGVKPFIAAPSFVNATANSNSNQPHPWIVFADDRFFLAVVWKSDTISAFGNSLADRSAMHSGYIWVSLFGDGIPLSGSDNYFCLLFTNNNNGSAALITLPAAETASNTYQHAARNIAGVDAAAPCALIAGGGPLCLEVSSREGVTHHDNLPARVPGNEIVSRPYVNDGTAYSMRGYVPGLWHSCHKYTDLDQFEVFDVGAHRFMVVKFAGSSNYRNHILVDISEHWRP